MILEGGTILFEGRYNGTWSIVVDYEDGCQTRLFPFESKDECGRFIREATVMPRRLYEFLKANGVRE